MKSFSFILSEKYIYKKKKYNFDYWIFVYDFSRFSLVGRQVFL